MSRSNRSANTATAGVAVAACVACCAGPLLGFVAAAGLLSALGVALFGATGLLVLVPAVMPLAARRRRQQAACRAPEEPVRVELSGRR